MTGQELFHALSFVDERYIMEAETARLQKMPWMKVLSVAACLCILIVGAFALENIGHKGAMEAITEEAAAPAAPAATEAAPRQESAVEEAAPETAGAAAGELQHVPYAKLRVVAVLEEGRFEAIAEATQEMEADTQVTVVVDPAMVPGEDRQISNDLSVITVDAVFEIYDGAYDAGTNILYVAEVFFEEGE